MLKTESNNIKRQLDLIFQQTIDHVDLRQVQHAQALKVLSQVREVHNNTSSL